MRLALGLFWVALGLCGVGACSGGESEPSQPVEEPLPEGAAGVLEAELFFYRWVCSCEAREGTLKPANDPCVRTYFFSDAERTCRESVLQANWSTAQNIFTCWRQVWEDAQDCLVAEMCVQEDCWRQQSADLAACPDVPEQVQDALDACN